jgi:hypothetical protein
MISNEESKLVDLITTKTTLSQTKMRKLQPTDRYHIDNMMLNQGKECSPLSTPAEAVFCFSEVSSASNPLHQSF